MSRRKRTPVAEIGDEEYLIVRHTHDVELAKQLMRAKMVEEWPNIGDIAGMGRPDQVHVRVRPVLPGSWGEDEGLAFIYQECKPGRGAFPAVVFR